MTLKGPEPMKPGHCSAELALSHPSKSLTMQLVCNITYDTNNSLAYFAGGAEYTDCMSAEGKTPPTSVLLVMTLNNLMVRL